jgi:hypothetical protein
MIYRNGKLKVPLLLLQWDFINKNNLKIFTLIFLALNAIVILSSKIQVNFLYSFHQ